MLLDQTSLDECACEFMLNCTLKNNSFLFFFTAVIIFLDLIRKFFFPATCSSELPFVLGLSLILPPLTYLHLAGCSSIHLNKHVGGNMNAVNRIKPFNNN